MLGYILAEVLTKGQREAGMYLSEDEDHILLLKRGDEVLATFYATVVTIPAIQAEADKYL